MSSLDPYDSTGGFLPRLMMVRIPEPSRLLPVPRDTDARLVEPLARRLRLANDLKGSADLSDVVTMYGNWYKASHRRFTEQPNRALAMPYFNRLRTQVLKLGVVYEVSLSGTLRISAEAMNRAFAKASEIEQTIFGLLTTGMSKEGSEVDKVAELVKAGGAKGILQSELTRALQNVKRRDREDRIQTLKDAGTIQKFYRKTAGRSAVVFVHQLHLREHSIQYGDDHFELI